MLLRVALAVLRTLRVVRLLRVLLLLLIRKTFAFTAATASAAAPAVPALTLSALCALTAVAVLRSSMLLRPSVLLRRNWNSGALLQHSADNLRGTARGGFVFWIGGFVMRVRRCKRGRRVGLEWLRFVVEIVIAIACRALCVGFRRRYDLGCGR